jgi:hypothetical protein
VPLAQSWKEYQSQAAELFRELGCDANVEQNVRGARAEHVVDVWVRFKKFGLETSWVVECKCWKSAVTKEKVLALKSIVEDVGADRGLLLSKSGFQAGAIRAAESTNITLTDLDDLKSSVQRDLFESLLQRIETRIIELKYFFLEMNEDERRRHYQQGATFPVEKIGIFRAVGALSVLQFGFERVRLAKPPYPYAFDEAGTRILQVTTLEEFVERASNIANELESVKTTLEVES